MSVKFMSHPLHHTHSGPNVLCPRIGILSKVLVLLFQKSPNNKNALVQVTGELNKPQAFT